jgi:hypothetical protein
MWKRFTAPAAVPPQLQIPEGGGNARDYGQSDQER